MKNTFHVISDTSDERIEWCKDNLLSLFNKDIKCSINSDNKLEIYGNILISNDIEELPIKIDIVYGDLWIDNAYDLLPGKFKSLKNMPDEVHGNFNCSLNQLTSLEGCPKIIDGTFWCTNNKLTELTHLPEYVGGSILYLIYSFHYKCTF